MPASRIHNMKTAKLTVADVSESKKIAEGAKEVDFEVYMQAGKYDLESLLTDENGNIYTACYVYIEKL